MSNYGDVPMVPAIWPMGSGVVVTARGEQGGMPVYLIRAVPDNLIADPGTPMDIDVFEKLAGSPTLVLAFKDARAVARMADDLNLLAMEHDAGQFKEPRP